MAEAGNTGWFAGVLKSFVAVEVKATLTAAACFLAVGLHWELSAAKQPHYQGR